MSLTSGNFVLPPVSNEPSVEYYPGSPERASLDAAIAEMKASMPFEVPCVVDGKEVRTNEQRSQLTPHSITTKPLATYHCATPEVVASAIAGATQAQKEWAATSWYDRATIFVRAADLVCGKYRWQLIAATMLGQGKNAYQAEVDAIAELADFFRFSVRLVDDLYKHQPMIHPEDQFNRIEYRPLEGFVLAVSPFNFTAIGGNLVTVPAILGNVALWKPSPMATYANYLTHKILLEAGVPGSVIQFLPTADAPALVEQCVQHRDFAALHFTGSTAVLRSLWQKIALNVGKYRSYPRIIGETGGKNFHLVHPSADIRETVIYSLRSAFEYNGQKCSALGRLYLPRSLVKAGWIDQFVAETAKIKQGSVEAYDNFIGPVINEASFDNITAIVDEARRQGAQVLAGGSGDKTKGFFYQPTILLTDDPKAYTMQKEIFGPVVTIFVYEDDQWAETCSLIDDTTEYALTGSIFSYDRQAMNVATSLLRNAAGNLYLNEKTTGAQVGQQPFGGTRASGTNDKSGTIFHFSRFVSARSIKDNFGDSITFPDFCAVAPSLARTGSDYVVGQFKLRHPDVYSIDDVGMLVGGPIGREAIGIAFWLYMTMVTGSGLLGISIGLNAVSSHGTCTAVFVAVAAIVTFLLASIRTLGRISWLGWIGLLSILAAIFTLAVSVGVQDRPDLAPQTGPWIKEVNIINDPSFYKTISAVSVLVFSFAGTPAFFGIVSEMRQPKLYTRSMLLCQAVVTAIYLSIGIVVYYFAGQYVASPALGSAGVLMKKVCYGLALPGLCVTTTIYSHLPAKFIFVRILRGSKHLTSNSLTHWAVWLSCVFGCVLFSYIIASAVPAFGGLVGLIGALFGTLMSMQVMGCMWLYDNWERRKTDASLSYRMALAWAIFVIIIGSFLMVAGTYGSVLDIKATLDATGGSSPWSCADNSG